MKYRILLILLIIPFIWACSGEKSQQNNIFIYGRSADAVGLDPGRETDGETFAVTSEIFEGLVGFKPGSTEIEPVLAESYTISKDGLVYNFNLRKNAKFHDGTPFNADAVVFNFERQYLSSNEYNQYGPWKFWGYMGFDDIFDSITKESDYQVTIVLKKPVASFLASLAMDFIVMVSPTAVAKYKENFTNNPVGTGPFKFVSWKKGDSSVLERNEDYWGGAPSIEKVVFRIIPDPTARTLALKNEEIDAFVYPSPDDIESLREDKDINLFEDYGLNVGYLSMNTQKEPFSNVNVRRAINYAIDKEAIIKASYGELGQAAYAPIPPTMWAYNPDITKYRYNVDKAKELLADAGYADGFTTTLLALPVTRPYMPQGQKVAEIVQQQLAQINITATIQTLEWGAHLEKTDHGDYDLAFLGWIGDNGDPDNFLGVLLAADRAVVPAGNIAFWKNEEFTDLIEQALVVNNVEGRKKLYFEAQEVFAKEVPWVVIANSKTVVPYNKRVHNFVKSPVGEASYLKYVTLE